MVEASTSNKGGYSTMMPWEHAIIGYVAYSLFTHAVYRDSPTARETLVVVFASLLPDLIDKPLAWHFGLFEGGYALGHSIFFAVPLSVVIGILAYERGRPRDGWAFGIGYLLHLPFDILPTYVGSGELLFERVLWPIGGDGAQQDGLSEGFVVNFVPYVRSVGGQLLEGDPSRYVLFVLGIGSFAFLLWVYDGMPVAREGYYRLRDRTSRVGIDREEK